MNIGIDIGGSHTAVGVVDDNGIILEQFEKDYTQTEKENLMPVVEDFIAKVVNGLKERYEIKRLGIAIPGTIADGVVLRSVNLGVCNYDIAGVLERRLGFPVSVRNDAKCAAIAEYKYGKNSVKDKVLFLGLGTGIGGAFIYNGALSSGSVYDGYEFGHMVLKPGGIRCNCGKNGCFEKYGSILCFKRKCIERLGLSYEISGPDLRGAIEENMNSVQDIIENYIDDLALGLSNLINIFEPDVTIIGGGFARYDYLLLDLLKKKIVSSNLLFNERDEIKIEVASLGNDAGIIGAVILWNSKLLIYNNK